MSADKSRVLNFLEIRFDYLSARNVLSNWRKVNGIKDEIDSFDDAQLRSLLNFLKAEVSDAGRTIAGIEHLILNPDVDDKPAVVAASEAVEPVIDAAPVEEAAPVEDVVPVDDAAPVDAAPAEEAAPVEDIAPADDVAEEAAPAEDAPAEDAPAEDNASHEGGNKKKNKKKK